MSRIDRAGNPRTGTLRRRLLAGAMAAAVALSGLPARPVFAQDIVVSGGAVQIGNAIAEKKVLDVILQARDKGLYTAITDCGAGGFSSAVGEMGADLGASVQLEKCPLKYDGLSYTEIWISESQERMVLAVAD